MPKNKGKCGGNRGNIGLTRTPALENMKEGIKFWTFNCIFLK